MSASSEEASGAVKTSRNPTVVAIGRPTKERARAVAAALARILVDRALGEAMPVANDNTPPP